jgi:tetratricopeptide (TPR) repeat protein
LDVPIFPSAETILYEEYSDCEFPVERRAAVEDDHPSLETLARWLAGELAHEQVVRELAPHFLGSCPACRALREEIDRLLAESGHWDEVVAVVETREAPELLGLLGTGPHAERMRRAEEMEELHTWGVCQLLLKKVREQVFSDPAQAVETAHLAVRLAGHLGNSYHPDWVLELRARAFAHLGNARRVLGELKAAEDAFLLADECLQASGLRNALLEAEVLSLRASLRLDQGRFMEAQDLVDRALPLFENAGHAQEVCRTLLKRSKILTTMGMNDLAIDVLRTSTEVIDPEKDRRLFAYANQSLVGSLVLAGRYKEAERLIPEVKKLFDTEAEPLDWLRLRWNEANLAQGLGRLAEAEQGYRAVQHDFLNLGKALDAALVSLDLAILLWEQGRTEELKQLAAEVVVVFESREVQREAMAALLLFQQACIEERVTGELLRQIASQIRRERRGNGTPP